MMRADQSLPSSSPSSFIQSLSGNANDASPRRVDVVFGCGGNIHPNHPGNVVYERLINSFRQRYLISRDALVKETIVESIVRAIQEKGGRFLEFIISDQSMMNSSEGIINGRRGGIWYTIGDSQAVLRTARELSNRNNNPNLFTAATVAAFDQNRRMAVAQEQRQREDQLLLLQRQQQQQLHHENFVTAGRHQQNHGHFATAGNNAVASMGYGVVENDRDRAKAAVAAAFGSEMDEERTALRTTENSMEMERMMILRDEQQQQKQQQQQQKQQQQAQLQQQHQHQQLQRQLQLQQQQQQQLLQRQQQAQALAQAMEERQKQHQLEQQVHVQSQAQANALQQQSVPELYTVRERDVVIASASSNFWTQNPGNISVRIIRRFRMIYVPYACKF
jgi:DNA segregation ATPase FtsK/SpoIIIE-like protein